MKCFTLIVLMASLSISLEAQIKVNNPYQNKDKTYIPDVEDSNEPTPENPASDEAAIRNVVLGLMQAMHENNGSAIKSYFAAEGRLLSTESTGKVNVLTVDGFAKMINESPKGSLEEKITSMDIKIDEYLASVWAGYDFYLNNSLHHCGVDAFQMIKTASGWKILQIADTRKDDCMTGNQETKINKLLDAWHESASNANAQEYFDLISADGYYLGTDATEHWNKAEFYQFAKPYFDKGNAWKFNPSDRKVYFSDNARIAWFDELLDTWMGTCRGSGVLELQSNNTWKIKHYNLAVLVPNDLIQDYLQLLKK